MDVRAYLRAVLKSWWNVMTAVGVILGVVTGASGIDAPRWLWIALIGGGIVFAQFQAARRALHTGLRQELPPAELTRQGPADLIPPSPALSLAEARSVARATALPTTPATEGDAAPQTLKDLDPLLLRGRIYPYSYARVVDPSDKALPIRVALAARVPTEHELGIGPSEHEAFEEAVATSLFEHWILGQTTLRGRAGYERFWRAVDPTMSWIVTLKRPAVSLQIQKGWTVDAQAQLSLRPDPLPGVAGWLTLILDAVVRPADEVVERSRPLGLQELFELIYVMTASLLDEIGPASVKPLAGRYELLSFAVIITPTGATFNDFVPFDWISGDRADGSRDVPGAEWSPSSQAEIDDPEARADGIRRWITRILRDSGFIRGYEADIERLQPPTPPPKH